MPKLKLEPPIIIKRGEGDSFRSLSLSILANNKDVDARGVGGNVIPTKSLKAKGIDKKIEVFHKKSLSIIHLKIENQ